MVIRLSLLCDRHFISRIIHPYEHILGVWRDAARRIDKDPPAGYGELTSSSIECAYRGEGLHDVFCYWLWFAHNLGPGRIESYGHEQPLPQKYNISCRHVSTIRGVLQ